MVNLNFQYVFSMFFLKRFDVIAKWNLCVALSAKRAIDAIVNMTERNLFWGRPMTDEHVARFGPPMRGPGY